MYNGSFWSSSDLTLAAHGTAPARGSSLHRYWTNCCDRHVNFLDQNGHVHELYITNSGQPWQDFDLTKTATHGTAAKAGSPLGGYSSGGDEHVIFIDGNNHVHELFKTPSANWYDTDLTSTGINGTPAANNSTLTGDWNPNSSQQHINFVDGNRHLHELVFLNGQSSRWKDNDLTSTTNGATLVASGSPLARDHYPGCQGGDCQEVRFMDSAGHIHNFWCCLASGWLDWDITANAQHGTAANIGANQMASDLNVTVNQGHINFFVSSGTEWRVHELVEFGAQSKSIWSDNDLNAPALPGSAIDRYWGNGNDQHVNFIGVEGDLHELYIGNPSGSGNNGGGPGCTAGAAGCACKNGACNAGLTCFNGSECIACGGLGKICCQPGNTCQSGLTCQSSPSQNSYTCLR